MLKNTQAVVAKVLNALGHQKESRPAPIELHYLQRDPSYQSIIAAVEPFTMTSYERIAALVDAVRYVGARNIPGAIVECGVWRGGSAMAAALALQEAGDIRDLYLFDTFSGMTPPTDRDVDYRGIAATPRYEREMAGDHNEWCYASLDDVRRNLSSTGYPENRVHFVQGDVLETLPCEQPTSIAILRLDTDWYESTQHELKHLYGRLSPGGVLIIDDYGHWEGCRRAVDEFFADEPLYLCRLDRTGRLAVK